MYNGGKGIWTQVYLFGNTKSHEVSIMKQILSGVLFFTRCKDEIWLFV